LMLAQKISLQLTGTSLFFENIEIIKDAIKSRFY